MRKFTDADFLKLQEEIEKLKIDNNLFNDERVFDVTRRNIFHSPIRVSFPDDDETEQYAKQIIDVLLKNSFIIAKGKDLQKDRENPEELNYKLVIVEQTMYGSPVKEINMLIFRACLKK